MLASAVVRPHARSQKQETGDGQRALARY